MCGKYLSLKISDGHTSGNYWHRPVRTLRAHQWLVTECKHHAIRFGDPSRHRQLYLLTFCIVNIFESSFRSRIFMGVLWCVKIKFSHVKGTMSVRSYTSIIKPNCMPVVLNRRDAVMCVWKNCSYFILHVFKV